MDPAAVEIAGHPCEAAPKTAEASISPLAAGEESESADDDVDYDEEADEDVAEEDDGASLSSHDRQSRVDADKLAADQEALDDDEELDDPFTAWLRAEVGLCMNTQAGSGGE
jgi:hypothetical protein